MYWAFLNILTFQSFNFLDCRDQQSEKLVDERQGALANYSGPNISIPPHIPNDYMDGHS